MIKHIDRDEIDTACNVIAGLSCNHRDLLDRDQRFILARAHSILESLASLAQYRCTRECKAIELSTDVSNNSVVSKIGEQDAYWGYGAKILDLEHI
jgi:HPt (histidine-containing phosphotransfer) domain-containing protein